MILPFGIYAHNRAVVTPQYAVMPPEGVPVSRLPGFDQTAVRILTAPAMGARFAQMLLEIEAGGGTVAPHEDGLEHVFYLLSGSIELSIGEQSHRLEPHGYAYVPMNHSYHIRSLSDETSRLIWIKRPYDLIDVSVPEPIVGRREDLPRDYRHTDGRYWQYLLPLDDMAFDMHINILGFEPGVYFPHVETHIMEHGLYMLEGQGIYMLAGDQHEVQTDDFIWMGPFCPQFYFCTGWSESAYLLYKDVNRDVTFR